ncbi:MAG: RnfABCDGE type electron transport complex subunit D [Thermoplasmata archaeon]|nr:RnfABCDGE type electron transport complex subunit D [Thermoplasmata archaeon]
MADTEREDDPVGSNTPGHSPEESVVALRWPGGLPPARITWIGLAVLAVYGTVFLQGMSFPSLLLLPMVAISTDLGLQGIRFSMVRWPDAALASGLFLTLLLPPSVPLVAAGTVTIAAIVLRHAIRYRGRPALNPAACGLLLGAVVFGTAPAWWVALGPYGEWLMLGIAAVIIVRNLPQWQLPATFFAIYAPFMFLDRVLFSAALAPRVLLLGVFDPAVLFFGLFMVPEPRSAPSAPTGRLLYAGVVALSAVFLPTVLPSVGIVVALLVGNLLSVLLRWEHEPSSGVPVRGRRAKSRRSTGQGFSAFRWSVGRRASAAVLVLLAVGVVGTASIGPSTTPSVLVTAPSTGGSGGGGSGGGSSPCAADSTSIPASTLASLHQILGPSVILSYSASTGSTVFFDPVNQVTVTETDLYEDYGYAEFNGDDFAVTGCSP